MKKKLFILAFLLCALTLISDYAMADFYVIAGGRRVGTEIKSLPYTISSPGFYYITKDLTIATNATGITVTADHVTLDLMGFGLIGSGSGACSGVFMNARTNVEIRNGTIRNFGRIGIRENSLNGKGHRIINIRVEGSGDDGIYLSGESNLVKGCTAMENEKVGIYAGIGSTITGNTCCNNQTTGIYARAGSTITGNTCRNNTDHGIRLSGNSLVDQNTAYNNGTNITGCGTCTFGMNHAP